MSNYEGMYADAIRQLNAALARAEKAERERGLLLLQAYGGEGLYSQKCAAEAREVELRAKVEALAASLAVMVPWAVRSAPASFPGHPVWSEIERARALLAPTGEKKDPTK